MLHARVPPGRPVPPPLMLRLLTGVVLVALAATAIVLPRERAAAAGTGPVAGAVVDAAVDASPNVVLVSTDDQATTDMRFMPFTRRYFARNGVTFRDAISSFPLCCPARATILTGQLSHNHHVLTNNAPYGGYTAFVDNGDEDTTLPTWLQAAGYQTMFVGKYLNGYGQGQFRSRVPVGWSQWNGLAGHAAYSYTNFRLIRDGVPTPYPNGYNTAVFGQITRGFIQSSAAAAQPFFVWESDLAPHGGCQYTTGRRGCRWGPPRPARQDRHMFPRLKVNNTGAASFNERVVVDKPRQIRKTPRFGAARLAKMTHYNRQRARSLVAVDRSFRATIGELRRLGQLDNTLVIFTSDNGFLMGQHRWQGKILPYEQSLHVPLMISGPGFPAGTRSTESVSLADIAPTIAQATGATPTVEQDGQPLQPVVNGTAQGYGALAIEAGPLEPKDFPTWFYHGVRTKRYTYIAYPGLGEFELYDRRKDPDEMTNVAYRPAYRQTRAALTAKLRQLTDCAGAACHSVGGDGVPEPRPEPYLDSGATVHPDELGSIRHARQVVTITAPNWRTGRGRLTAWVRHRRTWTVQEGPFPVQLGSHGLIQGPRRRQGTGETPAGTFTAHNAFGLGPAVDTRLPYRKVDRNDYWVYDPRDPKTYNVEQSGRGRRATWRTGYSVRWAAQANRFPRAILMDYNLPRRVRSFRKFGGERRSAAPADVRKGSFVLHAGRRLGDNGWVSMSAHRLTRLLRWVHNGPSGARFVVGTPSYLRNNL